MTVKELQLLLHSLPVNAEVIVDIPYLVNDGDGHMDEMERPADITGIIPGTDCVHFEWKLR